MGFSGQEYWSGLPFPSPGVLPDPGIETKSLALQADSLLSESLGQYLNTKYKVQKKKKRMLTLREASKDKQNNPQMVPENPEKE